MKIITNNSVFVQKNDIAYLNQSDLAIPASIFMKVFGSGVVIIDDSNRYDFVEFNAPEEIEFFKGIDWMIDYNQVKDLSEKETIALGQSIAEEKNEIAQIPAMNLDANIYGKDQYVVFTLDTHTYCIYSLYVKELINMKNYPVTKIPYTPDFVKGIINLKGNFYSVVDLKKLIGFDSPKTDTEQQALSEGKAIVLDSPELKLALYVDEINNIINISKEYIEPKNDMSLDNLFINAEAYIDNTVYNILNLDKLINDERLYIDISN